VFISVLETMQAIAGARDDTSNRANTPNLWKIRIALIRVRLPNESSKWRFRTLPHPQDSGRKCLFK
jgi:1,2-phenylacetyl-CoA epoxidase PaaB subunit